MVSKKSKRVSSRRQGFVAIPFYFELTLGNLAQNGVAAGNIFTASVTNPIYLISADVTWSISDLTAGEGPIRFGFYHGDLSSTEVQENLTVDGEALLNGDIIAIEKSRRPVRSSGVFSGLNTEEVLNDGQHVRTKLRFSLHEGKNLAIFGWNRSGAALTTGSFITAEGILYARRM